MIKTLGTMKRVGGKLNNELEHSNCIGGDWRLCIFCSHCIVMFVYFSFYFTSIRSSMSEISAPRMVSVDAGRDI